MPSPVYRGGPTDDPKGFQPQAVGNYPFKSDVADYDNIYLSDQGWAYRHYKSLDESEYWDEIIWAGDVTDPPSTNNPVDIFGTANPHFLTGDGIQAISGPYPKADPVIGTIVISANDEGLPNQAETYTFSTDGTLASGDTWKWEVAGPGTATFGSGTQTGTFSGNTPANANVSITFPTAGSYDVKLTVTSGSTGGTSFDSKGISITAAPTVIEIGTVTIGGDSKPLVGVGKTYKAQHTGTATIDSYTWVAHLRGTTNTATGVNITQPGDDKDEAKVVFTSVASLEVDIKCTLAAADATTGGTSKSKTLEVTAHTDIGTATVAGGNTTVVKDVATSAYSVTFTGASNPAPNDLTYAWSADPATGVTFTPNATNATPTVTVAAAGTVDIKCTVSSAISDPGLDVATAKTLTVTAS